MMHSHFKYLAGDTAAGFWLFNKRSETQLVKNSSKLILSLYSGQLVRVFSERVVTETDTHAVRLSASSRHCQQAPSAGVRLLQTPDLF